MDELEGNSQVIFESFAHDGFIQLAYFQLGNWLSRFCCEGAIGDLCWLGGETIRINDLVVLVLICEDLI